MRILVVGGTGRIGAAVVDALGPRHDVVVASRSSGIQVDISDGVSIDRMYERTGPVDAVVSVLGSTPFPPFEEMTADHVCAGIANKLVGQIDLVLRGRPHVSDGGPSRWCRVYSLATPSVPGRWHRLSTAGSNRSCERPRRNCRGVSASTLSARPWSPRPSTCTATISRDSHRCRSRMWRERS